MNEFLLELARDAGASHGTAHKKVCDAITSAATNYGLMAYDDSTVVEMRGAFAEACAKSGTAKKNGLSIFARAWDSLVAALNLQPRPRKGQGRNGKTTVVEESADDTAAPAKPDPLSREVIARIKAEAVSEFIAKAGIDVATFELAAESWASVKSGTPSAIKDAMHALRTLGNVIGEALQAAGLETQDSLKARIKAAAERGEQTAATDAESAAAKPADKPVKAKQPAKAPVKVRKPSKPAKPTATATA